MSFPRMCQVFIGKVLSGEMRVVELQLSRASFAEPHSEAHRKASVLVKPLMGSGQYRKMISTVDESKATPHSKR